MATKSGPDCQKYSTNRSQYSVMKFHCFFNSAVCSSKYKFVIVYAQE